MARAKPYKRRPHYGRAHVVMRQTLLDLMVDGETVCARCRKPMWRSQKLHLDHNDDRTGYLGLAHAYCNSAAAGQKAQKLQRAGERKAGVTVIGGKPKYIWGVPVDRVATEGRSRDW